MKTIVRAGAALLLTFACAAHAQQAPQPAAPAPSAAPVVDADPALWVVEDADTRIYLFGTVHALKPGLGWFDEAVRNAFDASGQVMLEMVEPDPETVQGAILKAAYNPAGPTVAEQLPEGKRAAYAAALAGVGAPQAVFNRLDPWYSAMALTVLSLPRFGYDPNLGAEKVLAAAAKAAGKPVAGLETFEQQIGFFDALPQPAQVRFLELTLDQLPELGATLDKMAASWTAGQPDALAALMNEDVRALPEVGKVLLADRNARWADWIEKRMAEPGTVFVAVGAGHLAGGDSVQAFLARRKLEAKRVRY